MNISNSVSYRQINDLRKAQAKAVAEGKDTFQFDNKMLDVHYAKFMLDFLTMQSTSMGGKND